MESAGFYFSDFYAPEPNADCAHWVIERLVGPKRTLHGVIPLGFDAYLRLCHPFWVVDDEVALRAERDHGTEIVNKRPIRWDDLASDRPKHWHDIHTDRMPGMGGIDPPLENEWTKAMVASFFEVLGDQEIVCAFWSGFNCPEYESAQAAAKMPDQHWLYKSTVEQCREGWLALFSLPSFRRSGLSPTAIWPTNREWYLAVPYNLRCSYFGGSVELVEDVRRVADLETDQALPGDSLRY